jgi:hypothetical protein
MADSAALAEMEKRIHVVEDNLRQLQEQAAAAYSGEELMARVWPNTFVDRIRSHAEPLRAYRAGRILTKF